MCVLLPAPSMPSSVMKRPREEVMANGERSETGARMRRLFRNSPALIFCHGPVVLGQCRREFRAAVTARNEVQIRALRGLGYRIDRCLAGERDRRRRQTVAEVR